MERRVGGRGYRDALEQGREEDADELGDDDQRRKVDGVAEASAGGKEAKVKGKKGGFGEERSGEVESQDH